jgi:hypothetical protein
MSILKRFVYIGKTKLRSQDILFNENVTPSGLVQK